MKTFFDSKHYVSQSIDPGKDITQLLDGLEYSSFGLIVDANVPFDASSLPKAAFVERLHGGEHSKTISTALGIITRYQHLLDKESLICAIGGGRYWTWSVSAADLCTVGSDTYLCRPL